MTSNLTLMTIAQWCTLWTALFIAPCMAQDAKKDDACKAETPVVGASIVQASGESLQRKRWQPQGGVVQFTIKTFAAIPESTSFQVCFRWRTASANRGGDGYVNARIERIDHNNNVWTITVDIPGSFTDLAADQNHETNFWVVPLADVRIVGIAQDDKKADKTVVDVSTTIGITYPFVALVLAALTIFVALYLLNICALSRLKHTGTREAFFALRIISTPSAYASLSQLQIVLWTLVIAASAVYVMALSGDLIAITTGTLVLLGIAGGAALGAKAHTESQVTGARGDLEAAQKAAADAASKKTKTDADPNATQDQKNSAAKAAKDADDKLTATKARQDALIDPKESRKPLWSDLIVNENTQPGGVTTREIDVSRFQMLLFTLITAVFVLLNVLTTYVIPEIPTGFLTLMGISNGVYLGAKITQGTS